MRAAPRIWERPPAIFLLTTPRTTKKPMVAMATSAKSTMTNTPTPISIRAVAEIPFPLLLLLLLLDGEGQPSGHPIEVLPHIVHVHSKPELEHEPSPESDAMRGLRAQTLPGTTSHGQVSLTDVGCGVGGAQIGS